MKTPQTPRTRNPTNNISWKENHFPTCILLNKNPNWNLHVASQNTSGNVSNLVISFTESLKCFTAYICLSLRFMVSWVITEEIFPVSLLPYCGPFQRGPVSRYLKTKKLTRIHFAVSLRTRVICVASGYKNNVITGVWSFNHRLNHRWDPKSPFLLKNLLRNYCHGNQ